MSNTYLIVTVFIEVVLFWPTSLQKVATTVCGTFCLHALYAYLHVLCGTLCRHLTLTPLSASLCFCPSDINKISTVTGQPELFQLSSQFSSFRIGLSGFYSFQFFLSSFRWFVILVTIVGVSTEQKNDWSNQRLRLSRKILRKQWSKLN